MKIQEKRKRESEVRKCGKSGKDKKMKRNGKRRERNEVKQYWKIKIKIKIR